MFLKKLKALFRGEEPKEIDEFEFDDLVAEVEFEESDFYKCLKARGKLELFKDGNRETI